MAEGIEIRHQRGQGHVCAALTGGDCDCTPAYRASVFDRQADRKIRKTLATERAAVAWRRDALAKLQLGLLSYAPSTPVHQVAAAWLAEARAGVATTRSGDRYKPATIRAYEQNLRLRVLPKIGRRPFAEVRRGELQRLVDELGAGGLSASTIQTTFLPLRAMYRDALSRDEVRDNPTRGLRMPAVRGRRDRFASPGEAEQLLAALAAEDRPLWGTALYAGLRRGELVGLRWEDVDLAGGVIHVRRGWDWKEGEIEPKSREGRRDVPIPAVLRDLLVEHKMRAGGGRVWRGLGSVQKAVTRARVAWGWRWDRAAGEWLPAADEPLQPIGLHECRHTYASLMIAAGVNAKALSTFMGHATIAITLDLYGHLMPGSEAEAAGLLDTYLAAQRARAAGGSVPAALSEPAEA